MRPWPPRPAAPPPPVSRRRTPDRPGAKPAGPHAAPPPHSLDPVVIRKEVEARFSPEMMVANYVAAYEATIQASG